MKDTRAVLMDVWHLVVLIGFGVAQPLYALLGQNPEFFIAHKAGPAHILNLVIMLTLGLALGGIVIELVARLFGEPVRRRVHGVLVFFLAVLSALPIVKLWVSGSDLLLMGLALLAGLGFVVLYVGWHPLRLFVTVLSPAVLVFPLWFLVGTPVSRLVMPDAIGAQADIEITNPVPVVLVVMDEFNITALLDAEGNIDPVRFPNFAALTAQGWWFPNAVAAAESTKRAVPAIVTGRNAKTEVRQTPTATDHPQNLFTLLGDHYRLNVWESMTTLCPETLCGKENIANTSPSYMSFVADVAVIYLHIITPPTWRQQLPTLDSRWTGFGRAVGGEVAFKKDEVEFLESLARGPDNRDSHLEYFLSKIEPTSAPVLHFLHEVLPHVPYEYLSSGHRYMSERQPFPEGFIEIEEWIGEKPLIVTAYHRYLQQIGYLDRFLGQVKDTLETSQLFEKGLVIVTADHGVAFQRGLSRRDIQKGNESDILNIPMIVKLPGQREGQISERLVSGIDILPTIVEVLKIIVPWDMDGRSMFTDEESPRVEIAIPGVGRYQPTPSQRFPRLEWQVEHFGEHSPLDRLVPTGPYSHLIGQQMAELAAAQSGLQFHSGDVQHLEHVDPASEFLPALFNAQIVESTDRNFPIAIALNGRIWATTTTSEWDGKPNYLSVLLPPAAFQEGSNEIGVYRIEEPGGKLLLIHGPGGIPELRLRHDGHNQFTLVFSDRREIRINEDRGLMQGQLDSVKLLGNMLVFAGWGADLAEKQSAAEVFIFAGERLLSRVKPQSSRADIAEKYEQQALLHSGFHATVPVETINSPANEIRVVLLSSKDRTLLLPVQDAQKEVIRAALKKEGVQQ